MDNLELSLKEHLVIAYKYLAIQKKDDLTYSHLSCRAEDGQSFYIYPFGLLFEEVTAENLLRVDFNGNILEGSEAQYNQTGYIIHGNIYKAREDINSIFHLHTHASIAISSQKAGLLPISQFALHFYDNISYHEYNSLALDNDTHGDALIKDLGQNKVMLMRNHGMLTCGSTIWEANFYAHHLEQACIVQTLINKFEDLIYPSVEVCQQAVKDLLTFEKDLGWRDWQAIIRKVRRVNI